MAFNRWGAWLRSSRGQWILLLLFVGVAFFINVGADGLFSAQEGRAAVLTRNMIRSGNWMVLDFHGGQENEKPILSYWLYALSASGLGLNEFALRLPGVLAGLLIVILTVHLAGRIYDRPTAFLSGYLLATMATFLTLTRTVRIDIILAAFCMMELVLLYYGYFRRRKATAWLYLFYAVTGIGMMVKGPVNAVLPALAIVIYAVVFRRWRMFWELKPISGIIIMVLLGGPWFVYENMRTHGQFAWEFFVYHNLERFLGGADLKEGKRAPLYFYLGKLLAGALPWSLLIPFGLWQYRRRWRSLRSETWLLVIWIGAVFVFFSLAAIKRGDYILPLYPALAILLARYLVRLNATRLKLSRRWIYGWGVLVGVAVAALGLIVSGAVYRLGEKATGNQVPHLCIRDGQSMMEVSNLVNWHLVFTVLVAGLVLMFLFLIGRVLARGDVFRALAWFLSGMLLLIVMFFQYLQPILDVYNTNKPFCAEVRRLVPPDRTVAMIWNYDAEVIYYIDRPYEIDSGKDAGTGIAAYDYLIIFADKDYPRRFLKRRDAGDFAVLCESCPGHNSPMILLGRKTALQRDGVKTPH
ncbi:MAG: glycosyltransferase family 39 protein [Victivallales bacterium]|nr:glycosyltransferase family 39 protein [Victivallales bacterium]